jgi:hypothetical protein
MNTPSQTISIKMSIKFNHPVTAYALQMGGWLPLAFVSAPLLLVDRNIVGFVDQIAKSSPRPDLPANKWWFEFIDTSSVILNPVLCAMEGDEKRVPTFSEFRRLFDDACATLARGFPTSRIVRFSNEHYAAAYQTVQDLGARYDAERRFLLQVAPLITQQCAESKLQLMEDRILEIASHTGAQKGSLVLLAALSCLYEPCDKSKPKIGRKILKPVETYDDARAHNAISDLRALELLIASNALGGTQTAYCTHDKYLAAFWCAIQANNAGWEEKGATFEVRLGTELFPRLPKDQVMRITNRIRANDF